MRRKVPYSVQVQWHLVVLAAAQRLETFTHDDLEKAASGTPGFDRDALRNLTYKWMLKGIFEKIGTGPRQLARYRKGPNFKLDPVHESAPLSTQEQAYEALKKDFNLTRPPSWADL